MTDEELAAIRKRLHEWQNRHIHESGLNTIVDYDMPKLLAHIDALEEDLLALWRVAWAGNVVLRSQGLDVEELSVPASIAGRLRG